MINLLPPDAKESILYARRNTMLARWLAAIIIGLIGVIIAVAAGQFYLNQSAKSYAAEVEKTEQLLQEQKLAETQQRVTEISASMKLMVQVLSRQVLFSDLIRQVGAAIPPGAALTNLTINKLEGGIDLQFKAANYQTATQIQVNLEDPDNRIFEKADILGINCSSPSESSSDNEEVDIRYPCTANIRALFAKDNPFLFISKERGGATQ